MRLAAMHLAFVGVPIAAEAAGRAAAERAAPRRRSAFFALPSAAATCTPRARVRDQHAGLRFLEFQAAGDRAERAARAADQSAERAADAARIVLLRTPPRA